MALFELRFESFSAFGKHFIKATPSRFLMRLQRNFPNSTIIQMERWDFLLVLENYSTLMMMVTLVTLSLYINVPSFHPTKGQAGHKSPLASILVSWCIDILGIYI